MGHKKTGYANYSDYPDDELFLEIDERVAAEKAEKAKTPQPSKDSFTAEERLALHAAVYGGPSDAEELYLTPKQRWEAPSPSENEEARIVVTFTPTEQIARDAVQNIGDTTAKKPNVVARKPEKVYTRPYYTRGPRR